MFLPPQFTGVLHYTNLPNFLLIHHKVLVSSKLGRPIASLVLKVLIKQVLEMLKVMPDLRKFSFLLRVV